MCGRRGGWGARLALGLLAAGCAGARPEPRFARREPVWVDDDRRPVLARPAAYFSPLVWDHADNAVFRPLSEGLALEASGEAVNVNALDEVPDSSWFEGRLGRRAVTPEEAARGACAGAPLAAGGWQVTGAKPDGANPGFEIKAADGRSFLIKMDGTEQPERASTADVVGSLIYHAVGFFTPCNQVVFFAPGSLAIAPGARAEDERGNKRPLTTEDIDRVLRQSVRGPDGLVRASASELLAGKPLGPWRYQGTRADDPNDVFAHEDRRELRGSRLLAAWLNHYDAREQNSLALWVAEPGPGGHVEHALLDWGDCLGNLPRWPAIGPRQGRQYAVDLGDIGRDLVTLGIPRRPWDRVTFGPSGKIFGYFDVETFEPEDWRPAYPNKAFSRMTERDAAWAARMLARLTEAHLDAILGRARLSTPALSSELRRLLLGRRRKLLDRYLTRLSPLAEPSARAAGAGLEVCARDLAVTAGLSPPRAYRVRVGGGATSHMDAPGSDTVCVPVRVEAASDRGAYVVVAIAPEAGPAAGAELRVHLYAGGAGGAVVAGLER